MKTREMKQYGWVTGPVECRCTHCDWNANFIAVDTSVPIPIAAAFVAHDCGDYNVPFRPLSGKAELGAR